jgi:predicted secreted protein
MIFAIIGSRVKIRQCDWKGRKLKVKTRMRFFPLLAGLTVLCTAPSSGEDQAWFRFIGFSNDGLCVAWEMGGIQDGSGFQWIEMEITDTQSSARLDGFSRVWDQYVDEFPKAEETASAEKAILELCGSYGIHDGSCEVPLVFHPLTDLTAEQNHVVFCMESYSPRANSGEIQLTLETESAETDEYYPDWFPDPVNPLLTVDRDEQSRVFFNGGDHRQSGPMYFDYGIAAVYRNPVVENSLLVVLHAVSPGFEGPDGRFRVVSGSI